MKIMIDSLNCYLIGIIYFMYYIYVILTTYYPLVLIATEC